MKVAEEGLLPEIAGLTSGQPDKDATRTAGDVRAIETPALSAMHTIWLREHNRIVLPIQIRLSDCAKREIEFSLHHFLQFQC